MTIAWALAAGWLISTCVGGRLSLGGTPRCRRGWLGRRDQVLFGEWNERVASPGFVPGAAACGLF
jgi:hypothetical protein